MIKSKITKANANGWNSMKKKKKKKLGSMKTRVMLEIIKCHNNPKLAMFTRIGAFFFLINNLKFFCILMLELL